MTLNEQPSHPSHPNDLKRRKQTHTPAETHEVGEISADALLLAPVRYVVTCICAFIHPLATYLRSLRVHLGGGAPSKPFGEDYSGKHRINASKVAFYSIAVALFEIQVIVA